MSQVVHSYYDSWQKRGFDLGVLVVMAPVLIFLLLIISLLVFLTAGRPIFYLSKRVGRFGKTFVFYKFRTMKRGAAGEQALLSKFNQAPKPMFKIFADPRFVGVGWWLSRTGLDELPQLFNIIKGEMSLVGPRPLPLVEAKALPKSWEFRKKVSPGIFSQWSVAGNRHQSLARWHHLEQLTVARGGWFHDFKIISLTLVKSWCH